jgi:hypothetical protein
MYPLDVYAVLLNAIRAILILYKFYLGIQVNNAEVPGLSQSKRANLRHYPMGEDVFANGMRFRGNSRRVGDKAMII